MGEDRRPSVGGRPLEEDEAEEPRRERWSEERTRREAEALAKRAGVDGHEDGGEEDADPSQRGQ